MRTRSDVSPHCVTPDQDFALDQIVGNGPAMSLLKDRLRRLALASSNVLITGETGCGKELLAEAVHALSTRRNGPFICVNCAAIPESLFESELFGYERGAFTGAFRDSAGKLQEANGGTLFLDEIGELSYPAQAKLLRAIESKQVCRLGGRQSRVLDFRVVAATNRDLESMARANTFRQDLYYRLNVARLRVPALRDRMDDLPLLIDHFRRDLNQLFGVNVHGISPAALAYLTLHDWPGNVRELRNSLESIYLDLPVPCPQDIQVTHLAPVFPEAISQPALSEDDILLAALAETNWNKSKTALKLNWSRMTVYRKIAKLQIAQKESLSHETADDTPNETVLRVERYKPVSQTELRPVAFPIAK